MSGNTLELSEGRLASRLAGRLAERAQATNLSIAGQVVAWMDLVDLCREVEESLVLEESPSADSLAMHERVINLAINIGAALINQISLAPADVATSGQTPETLSASLELLHIFHRSRHPQISLEEVEAVRQRIFNAAA